MIRNAQQNNDYEIVREGYFRLVFLTNELGVTLMKRTDNKNNLFDRPYIAQLRSNIHPVEPIGQPLQLTAEQCNNIINAAQKNDITTVLMCLESAGLPDRWAPIINRKREQEETKNQALRKLANLT